MIFFVQSPLTLVSTHNQLSAGTDLEVLYALMTFGLPLKSLPVTADGTIKMELHERFLKQRTAIESERKQKELDRFKATGLVEYPTWHDIICGRGKPFQTFSGNLDFAKVIDVYRDEYQNSKEHLDKMVISTNILHQVQASGCRFLKKQPKHGCWELATDAVAREKVCQALRTKVKTKGEVVTPVVSINPETYNAAAAKKLRYQQERSM